MGKNEEKEYLTIVNSQNEETPIEADKETIHNHGLRHRHALAWVMNYQGEILLQKRATKKNNGRWERVGGHVSAGETAEETIAREVKEELGIEVPEYQLKPVSMQKKDTKKSKNFTYEFFFVINNKIEDLKIQEREISEAKYFTIEELQEIKKRKEPNYLFSDWDDETFEEVMNSLKERREAFLKFKEKYYEKMESKNREK